MDRHVIANMGTELGAVTSVFPADAAVGDFLAQEGRADGHRPLEADGDAHYDVVEELDLSQLVPLIAKPSSPGNVVPVREVEGKPIYQAYLGSSANPGYRDFAIAALIVQNDRVFPGVSFDVNPTTRGLLEDLSKAGLLDDLLSAGARLHQVGCNGCIGMGQAPATGRNSLRTVPRNFPGRSGTPEDSVWLCSPETAVASALTGRITDPRSLARAYPDVPKPEFHRTGRDLRDRLIEAPVPPDRRHLEFSRGPNIRALPTFDALPDALRVFVLLRLGDDISTDEIMPAGARVLPFRSNIPKIAEFCFEGVDGEYAKRALEQRDAGGHAIVAGFNYGQGSSREHAALAPRYLGLRIVLAKSFARIHRENLVNFGVLPLRFTREDDYDRVRRGSELELMDLRTRVRDGAPIAIDVDGKRLEAHHDLPERLLELVLAGGAINQLRDQVA